MDSDDDAESDTEAFDLSGSDLELHDINLNISELNGRFINFRSVDSDNSTALVDGAHLDLNMKGDNVPIYGIWSPFTFTVNSGTVHIKFNGVNGERIYPSIANYNGGGACNVVINGGTIKADNGDNDFKVDKGVNISSIQDINIKNTAGDDLVYTIIDTGLPAGTVVNISGLPSGYGTKNMITDADGKLYVYLPVGSSTGSITCHTIAASAGTGGTISSSGNSSVVNGMDKTYTITPNTNYVISDVKVDGVSVGTNSTYTFDDVAKDHTISAEFTYVAPSAPVPSETTAPVEEKKTDWQDVGKKIEETEEGGTVKVEMKDTTELPADTLEKIKGKDINLVLDMGNGVVWTINGKDVTDAKTVDMSIKSGENLIPVDVVNAITGETKTVQISLSHEGSFGFKAKITITLGEDCNDLFANLMYYNPETNQLEFVDSSLISDGKADLQLEHASEWAVFVDNKDYGVEEAPVEATTTPEVTTEAPAETTTTPAENPPTGHSLVPIATLASISLGAAVYAFAKRKK